MPTLKFSNRHVKAMDRVGGANLILDWPIDLTPGKRPSPGHERETTVSEQAVAEQLVRAECERHGLVPVNVRVVNRRRPSQLPRGDQYEQHLAVLIIGRRWVHASTTKIPPDIWPAVPTATSGTNVRKV